MALCNAVAAPAPPRCALLLWAVLAAAAPAASAASASIGHFTGISVSGNMKVTVYTSTDGTSSLTFDSGPSTSVTSSVNAFGTLVLSLPGTDSVRATVRVPGPLTYVGATNRATIESEPGVSGNVMVASQSMVNVPIVSTGALTSVFVSDASQLRLREGGLLAPPVPNLTVSVTGQSLLNLGGLVVDNAVITASSGSTVEVGTLRNSTIMVSAQAQLSVETQGKVGLSCSNSAVTVVVAGELTTYSDWGCTKNIFNHSNPLHPVYPVDPVYPVYPNPGSNPGSLLAATQKEAATLPHANAAAQKGAAAPPTPPRNRGLRDRHW